jgi:hypothetical protein
MNPTLKREKTEISSSTLETGSHQPAALAALTLFVRAHRAVSNSGFTLRRKGLSTDAIIVFTIGAITSIWTIAVILSAIFLVDKPCQESLGLCAARMIYTPWLM